MALRERSTIEPSADLEREVATLLNLKLAEAGTLVTEMRRLYEQRLTARFSETRVRERLKRTNPFLLQMRGITTVREWAERQIQGAVFASEEEAVGHMLEAVAKACHPGAKDPLYPDDFDYEVLGEDGAVEGYQVKLSWDCMPMSTRKNLSATIRRLEQTYGAERQEFRGYFAPCYGKARTTSPPGQAYISLSSREFWTRVGGGDPSFQVRVSTATALVCSEFRKALELDLVPALVERLADESRDLIGDGTGKIDVEKLFRVINP